MLKLRAASACLWLFLLAGSASAQHICFPSCVDNDAKMLALAGAGVQTFDSNGMAIVFGVPSTEASFSFGIFDGDHGGTWDSSVDPLNLVYTLYADPLQDGVSLTALGTWSELDFADNVWVDVTLPNNPTAQAPSGNYFYRLTLEAINQGFTAVSVFKVRTPDTNSLSLNPQAFNFIGALFNADDLFTIYPDYPNLTPTTYDGTWTFFVRLRTSTNLLEIWDGDLDHGDAFCTSFDSDDPDTPGFPFLPPWAAGTAEFEGVANGEARECGSTSGAPPDDFDVPEFQRSPNVQYTLTDPLNNVYVNANPSGNLEWERFSLTTGADPADYTVAQIPAGIYTLEMTGMDLSNFNSWFIPEVVGVCTDGTIGCGPDPRPFRIGDFVWRDTDDDGVQDGGEPGIGGVLLELVDTNGLVVATTTTDGAGLYQFEVEAGTYTVRVAASNFNAGGPLEGLLSTTGGGTQTNTVSTVNILTYDFGYNAEGVGGGEGCTPGYWKQSQHFDSWQGYTTGQRFNQVFGVNAAGNPTLLAALKQGGGGFQALNRHAVAALLNTANQNVDYLYATQQVITLVQQAYASGDPEGIKNQLAAQNEAGCPLN
jgi:hypothetical protein